MTTGRPRLRYRWAVVGAGLSLGSPLGIYVMYEVFSDVNPRLLTYVYNMVATFVAFAAFGYVVGRIMETNAYLSTHDELTGLFNRRFFMERMREALRLNERYGNPFALIMADLDHFKKVNDAHGHLAGDRCLKAVAQAILAEVRNSDVPARVGGEEFVVLCPMTGQSHAEPLAERIRERVAGMEAEQLGFAGQVTTSLGVTSVVDEPGGTVDSILGRLDRALYAAKRGGRDRVMTA